MFEGISFIKPNAPYTAEYRDRNIAPMFRRRFTLAGFKKAELRVCGLGYGYFWLNGTRISDDMFCAPVSDYNKTLWVRKYDVTSLLREGENIAAAWCGNGFFNESLITSWDYNKGSWRDNPKFILELTVDGVRALKSDESWKCMADTAVIFNQLRSGEYFDASLYDPDWNTPGFDDSAWDGAAVDDNPPKGVFRLHSWESAKECGEYPAQSVFPAPDGTYVFDIGQNISGYVRLCFCGEKGQKLTLRYAECLHEDGTLDVNGMPNHYRVSIFATDVVICDGRPICRTPLFTYHGFRYISVGGLTEKPDLSMITGIFVRQDVPALTSFESSDGTLNKLFRIGQMATWSNLMYIPTDCPTREKMGWANDAQASAEQMLTNFGTTGFFRKWLVDICDAMRGDGAMPGIIPTAGWGFDWGNGPVSDGVLFEVPWRLYQFTSDPEPLAYAMPYFKRYIRYYLSRAEEDGMASFGLDDWAPPLPEYADHTPVKFINTALYIKMLKIARMAALLLKSDADAGEFDRELKRMTALFQEHWLNADGSCSADTQTAAAMTVFLELWGEKGIEPLKNQLVRLIERRDCHHTCGMVGLRYLYPALDMCGLQQYAYKILTADGYPGYKVWLEKDATTLWETWHGETSKNHHMYSSFMCWMMNTIAGINLSFDDPAYRTVILKPFLPDGVDWVNASMDTPFGVIKTQWRRENGTPVFTYSAPEGIHIVYNQ